MSHSEREKKYEWCVKDASDGNVYGRSFRDSGGYLRVKVPESAPDAPLPEGRER